MKSVLKTAGKCLLLVALTFGTSTGGEQKQYSQKVNPTGIGVLPKLGFSGTHTSRLGMTDRVGQGIYVQKVFRGSLAEKVGLEQGDVILEINGLEMSSDRDYHDALRRSQLKFGGDVTMLVDDVRYPSYKPTVLEFNLDW